jgi:hypothetical protein
MSEEKETKNNSVKRDWLIAGGGAAGFFAILKASGWVDDKFDFSAIFNLVDFYMVAAKVAIASALAWTVKKLVFSNTLGKDFGITFDIGWEAMPPIEKSRWIIVVFIALFTTIMFNFG